MLPKVAIITGSNKGIGFGLVKELCKIYDGHVYLTSRNEERGMKALEDLRSQGLNPLYHQLDIDDPESVKEMKNNMNEEHGGVDVLINNAAIAFKPRHNVPFKDQAKLTVKTNFFSTLNVCSEMLKIMRPNGRVVNISSSLGHKALKESSEDLQKIFTSDELTMKELHKQMCRFVELAQENKHLEAGFTDHAYSVSKLGLTAATNILGKDEDLIKSNILVNCCCPGWINTDMGGPRAIKTVDHAVINSLFLALLPQGDSFPQGKYFNQGKLTDWQLL